MDRAASETARCFPNNIGTSHVGPTVAYSGDMTSHVLRSLLLATVLVTGCGVAGSDESDTTDEAEVHVAQALVVADQPAAEAAIVEADRVTVPLANGERYRGMSAGTIFVGARGAAASKNPDGFLRKVVSVSVDGDHIVVLTTPATISDAIVDGSVKASSSGARLDDHLTTAALKGIEIDFANKPIFQNTDVIDLDGKHAEFVEAIHLDHAVLTTKPAVDVDLRIQNGKVTRFTAKVEGNLDSSIAAGASVSSSGTVDDDVLAALKAKKHDIDLVVYESARLAVPTFSVDRVPVSPSVKFKVSLRCSIQFGGAVVANAGVEAKSYVRLGGVYANGEWGAPSAPTSRSILPSRSCAARRSKHAAPSSPMPSSSCTTSRASR